MDDMDVFKGMKNVSSNEAPGVTDEQAINQLVQEVSGALANGARPNEVVKGLVASGIPQQDAQNLVSNVAQHMQANGQSEGGGFPGWIIWIAILLGINLLSHLFDWGWVIY